MLAKSDAAGLASLLIFLPVASLVASSWDSTHDSLHWIWILAPAVFFLPVMYLPYNETALNYTIFFALMGLIGSALGAVIYRKCNAEPRQS